MSDDVKIKPLTDIDGKISYGILLVNLGSPDSASPKDVRKYLREFLSDNRVLDSNKFVQQFVLNFLILPTRTKHAAEAYEKIWTVEGSPLVISSIKQGDLLRERLDIPVEVGMRYGEPAIRVALRKLQQQDVNKVLLIPLYPHYAMSSYETAVVKVQEEIKKMMTPMELITQPPFYKDDDYILALVNHSMAQLPDSYDLLLFSYHGIPERHVQATAPAGTHCLSPGGGCEPQAPCQQFCYRAQVFETTRRFVKLAGIPDGKWEISFQSRLGRDPWLTPATDVVLAELPGKGVKKLVVISASFISDCLETLEELQIRGKEDFMDAGGEEFYYLRCLNESPQWIDVLERMSKDFMAGKAENATLAPTAFK